MTTKTKKPRKARARRRTLGDKLIAGLKQFGDALASGEPLERRLTRRHFELLAVAVKYDKAAIRALRKSLGLSQTLFATFLGVSPQAVRGWEQGTFKPGGTALRFFEEIRHDPDHWRKRVAEMTRARTTENASK